MNNFDDLFEQQPKRNPGAARIPEKESRSGSGGSSARRSSARKPTPPWIGFSMNFQRARATQGLSRHPRALCRSILPVTPFLSAHSAPTPSSVGGYKEWAAQGIEILEEEKRLPIIILEPGKAYRRDDGSIGQNFYGKEVYDISQTSAQGQYQPQVVLR